MGVVTDDGTMVKVCVGFLAGQELPHYNAKREYIHLVKGKEKKGECTGEREKVVVMVVMTKMMRKNKINVRMM